jgi:hypothetical protein
VVTIEVGAIVTGAPAASACDIESAPSVSTPQTRTAGSRACSAVATPEISAPPMLTGTSVTSAASSSPARRDQLVEEREGRGHVRGETQLRSAGPHRGDGALRGRLRHHDGGGDAEHRGGLREGDAVVTAATPAERSAGESPSSLWTAPDGLNEPARCSSSSLQVTGTPRWAARPGLGTVGVRST